MAALFIERNQEPLQQVFEITGVDPALADVNRLPEAVAATQPWVKGDHVLPEHRLPEFDEEQSVALHGLYEQMGLKDERLLPDDYYQQILVLGAVYRGTQRRMALAKNMLGSGAVRTRHIVLLGGERPVFEVAERHLLLEDIAAAKKKVKHDPWVNQLEKDSSNITWETDMMRLAATLQFGSLEPLSYQFFLDDSGEIPRRQDFSCPLNKKESLLLTLLHTKAVDTRQGKPRHTTEAAIKDWIEKMTPKSGSKIGFITANPHMERTGRAAQATLNANDHARTKLVVAGSAAIPGSGHSINCGEIARSLYEDQRQLAAA